jgi:hypothetical protein
MQSSAAGTRAESRRFMRFRLDAAVVLSWTQLGVLKRVAAFTRDFSRSGAYVIYEGGGDLQVGQQVWIYGLLPTISSGGEAISFHAQGSVVRHSSQGEEAGFAVLAEIEMAARQSIC